VSSLRVLAVEDDSDVREMLRGALDEILAARRCPRPSAAEFTDR